ncbi:unnamed protein product [Schistocephalus solidus]|uniref:Uncharacterized protein n=1 Tax=Schistocephalus solidus TaxID=70667 RepID=A0A183TBG3_SCHSO|nr:unnamed protein product [Schistocephalus solidus]
MSKHSTQQWGNLCLSGSTLSRNTTIDDEVAQRISKAIQTFGRVQASVWNRQGINLNTKFKMYKAVVLKTLLHGAMILTVYSNQARKRNYFHLSRLCRILKLRWQYRIQVTEVLERTGILRIHAMLREVQLRWSGHLVFNALVAASSWYPTLTCGSSKLVLFSGHIPGNRHDRRAKPGKGHRYCMCLHTRYVCSLPPALPLSGPPCPPLLFPANYPHTSTPPPPLSLLLPFYTYFFPSPSLFTLPSATIENVLRRGRHAIT